MSERDKEPDPVSRIAAPPGLTSPATAARTRPVKSVVAKRRREMGRSSGSHLRVFRHWVKTKEWAKLTAWEVKLFIDLGIQYYGTNNGDLSAPWSVMRELGWNSPGTLSKAITGLIRKGWLEKTRQGGRHLCSLYGLTVWPIDHCDGKLDVEPTRVASNSWRGK